MVDMGRRKPAADEPLHPLPRHVPLLTSPRESAMPEIAHGETKMGQSMPVVRHSQVSDMPAHHRLQPFANFRNRVMHTPPQADLHLLQLGLHTLANRLPKHHEPSPLRLSADMREAEEVEGLRLAQTSALPVGRRMASERDQARLFRVQFQLELLHAFFQLRPEPLGLVFVLEPNHDVVRITHHDHIAMRPLLTPCLNPEIEDVMEVDIRQQRRCTSTLRRTCFHEGSQEIVFGVDGKRISTWDGNSGALLEGVAYWGGEPLEYYANGYAHYLHTNWIGTMRMVTNNTGGVDGEFTSVPFGDAWTATQGTSNDGYQFAGLDIDSTDMEHAQFRQYSTTQGRWFSPDPYGGSYDMSDPQSFNRYTYVLNKPMSLVDPMGLDPCTTGFEPLGLRAHDQGDDNDPDDCTPDQGAGGGGGGYQSFNLDDTFWGSGSGGTSDQPVNPGNPFVLYVSATTYDPYSCNMNDPFCQILYQQSSVQVAYNNRIDPHLPPAPNNAQSLKIAQQISAVNNCQNHGQAAADAQPEVKPNGQDVLDTIYGGIGGLLTGGTGTAVSVGALVGLLSQSAGHAVQHGLAFLTSYHTCLASSGVGNAYNPYSPF